MILNQIQETDSWLGKLSETCNRCTCRMTRETKSLTKNGSIGWSIFRTNSINGHRLVVWIKSNLNPVSEKATIFRTIDRRSQWGKKGKALFSSCMGTAAALLGMHSWQDSLQKMAMNFAESTNLDLGCLAGREEELRTWMFSKTMFTSLMRCMPRSMTQRVILLNTC